MLVVALIALGAGARLLRALGLAEEPAAERICFSLALGLGCIAYGVLALGLLHLLSLGPVLALLAGSAVLAARPAAQLLRAGFRGVGGALRGSVPSDRSYRSDLSDGGGRPARPGLPPARPRPSLVAVVAGGSLALLLLGALVAALAPPTDWDGLSYHLADPAIYLRHRGIVPLFWESHSNFPFTIEMLYTVALLFKSAAAARVFHWLFVVLIALTLAGAWRRLWPDASAGARWLAPLLFCSAPVVLWSATVAYSDLALTAYELLALYGVWLWSRTGRTGWLWAGALCLGFALGSKMTALLQAGMLAPVVLAIALRLKAGAAPALRLTAAWAGIAAAVGSPWYIKSYLYTGNPVYPFLHNLFPGTRYWTAQNAADYAYTQGNFGIGHTWRHLLMAPWDLVAHADRFTDGRGAFAVLFGAMGPAFLALAVAVLLLRRRDAIAAGLLLYAGVYGLLWFHMSEQTRYLMPVLPLLALAGARALCGLAAERRVSLYPGALVAVVQAGLALATAWWLLAAPALPVVTGRESQRDYLARHLDVYPIYDYINAVLPENARILLIQETRGFYLEREYLWGNQGHHNLIPWLQFPDEREMRAFLRDKLGVTHVLINHAGAPRSQPPMGPEHWERTLWDALRVGTLSPLHDERGWTIYAME